MCTAGYTRWNPTQRAKLPPSTSSRCIAVFVAACVQQNSCYFQDINGRPSSGLAWVEFYLPLATVHNCTSLADYYYYHAHSAQVATLYIHAFVVVAIVSYKYVYLYVVLPFQTST
eukprot:scpid68334/ scgid19811/ 